jgi:DivIVA domain-containing protein
MDKKLNLTSDKIYAQKFTPNVKGYDPLEVDEFLDLVIADYTLIEAAKKEEEKKANAQKKEVDRLYARCTTLEALLQSEKDKVSEYEKLSQQTGQNLDLIKRISAYEKKLWSLGIDPNKIK